MNKNVAMEDPDFEGIIPPNDNVDDKGHYNLQTDPKYSEYEDGNIKISLANLQHRDASKSGGGHRFR
ncbi:MAG: hypothetical protein ACFFDN_02440 [Candidatus Hodarchaeota archaeon]